MSRPSGGDVEVRHSQFLLSSDWAMFDRINESAHLEKRGFPGA